MSVQYLRSIVYFGVCCLAASVACGAAPVRLAGGGEVVGGGVSGGTTTDSFSDDDFVADLGETGSAFLGPTFSLADSSVGYVDSAVIGTQLRLRFDAAYDFDEPDRAEYFYSTWTLFGGKTDPATVGPNDSIDAQTFSLYYEHQLTCRLSAFVQAALLVNNPSGIPGPGPDTNGFGDMVAGVKYMLFEDCNQLLTFQLKNYIPTGEAADWLSAGHYSLEPGLLYMNRLSDSLTMEAEIRDWIPMGGADGLPAGNGQPYAGNVLRYGVGVSYRWVDNCDWQITPVVELVGWSVLEGQKFAFPGGPVDADGDNIVNLKIGSRIARCGAAGDLYVGYGTALTSEAWYNDILRVDYRIKF